MKGYQAWIFHSSIFQQTTIFQTQYDTSLMLTVGTKNGPSPDAETCILSQKSPQGRGAKLPLLKKAVVFGMKTIFYLAFSPNFCNF